MRTAPFGWSWKSGTRTARGMAAQGVQRYIFGEQTVSFTAKPRRTGVMVREVAVTVVYRNNGNGLGFDRAMLNVDMTGTSYSYDSEGNLISASDNAGRNQTYTYSNANELLEAVDAKNERYTYTYAPDNEHRLLAARSNQRGNGTVYSYDDYGNATWFRTGTVNEDGTLNTSMPFIGTSRGFNEARNYVTYEQDARGNRVTYTLNDANGQVSKVTSPPPTVCLLRQWRQRIPTMTATATCWAA